MRRPASRRITCATGGYATAEVQRKAGIVAPRSFARVIALILAYLERPRENRRVPETANSFADERPSLASGAYAQQSA
jgi:hypothetical protein